MKRHVLGLLLLSTLVACNKDEDKNGDGLGLPEVKPPVERNTPAGIQGNGAGLVQAMSPLATLGSRLFTNGPTSIMERLAAIDLRLREFDSQQAEAEDVAPCTKEEAKLWAAPTALPGGAAFPIYLQCSKAFGGAGSSFQLGFGIKDDYAYLIEIQTTEGASSAPKVATLVRARLDGTATEAWITMQKFDNSQTVKADDYFFLAIKVDDATKSLEVAVGGSGQGIGVDCGVRVRSNGTHIFGSGIFASFGDRGVETCDGAGDGSSSQSTPKVELCVDATTLAAADAASCAALTTFTLPELTHFGLEATGGKAASDALIAGKIEGVTAFAPKE